MARRPSYLHALVGAVAAVALSGSALAVPAAAAPLPAPPAPGPEVSARDGAQPAARQGAGHRQQGERRARARDEYDAPLEIIIDGLTPGVLPRSGPITVRGTVTNVDLETWEGINLYPMFGAGPGCTTCPEPITSADQLAEAAATDPEAPVGERYTDVSNDVARLHPGESATYSIRIPQRVLRELFGQPGDVAAGVYWFGVHASGSSEGSPRDGFADGRARTFLPVVPTTVDQAVDTAVVVPLRGRIAYDADGQLAGAARWQRSLSPDGDLGGPLAFGAASGVEPVTWLVDPAIPDAVQRLALGNPPREVQPVPEETEEPSPSESASADTDDAGNAAEDGAEEAAVDPLTRAAESWLRQAEIALGNDQVATLPFGDLDVAAAATTLPDLYAAAREHPGSVLSSWDIEGMPVVVPPSGYLDRSGVESITDGATVVLGDDALVSEAAERAADPAYIGDRPILVRSGGAADGGPGPDPRRSPVALRQRILAEAAVRLLRSPATEPDPLVVVLPPGLDAAGASTFWEGLEVDWLRLVELDDLVGSGGGAPEDQQLDPAQLEYPQEQQVDEVDAGVLVELDGLVRDARTLQSVLGEDYRISGQLLDEALAGASYAMRDDPQAEARLARTRGWVRNQLDRISVDAPRGVTLSGTSGSFNVAVSNSLDFPVTVRLEASADSGARIDVSNPIVLAANSRSSVPVSADMSRPGVHNVRLRLTDLEGRSLGDTDQLPIRSGQVGVVIWAVIGTGLGILAVAIGIRLYRRVRGSGRSADGNDEPGEPDGSGQPASGASAPAGGAP
ncbi:DUF6049 family protein [Nocardioides sp. SYSU DS0651]|uniref:DUF6049 family protein n=1 Tax=Nocardioides sp. SYSU DS0651 TaxID=3415955 RepID=UPI003F4B6230